MSYITRYKVALIKEDELPYHNSIQKAEDTVAILGGYFSSCDREHFIVLMLDAKNKVIGLNTVAIGSLTDTIVHPREVFKPAVISNAAAIIMAHNHPSGDPSPSEGDLRMTKRLKKVGDILGVTVLDHIIYGGQHNCYSVMGGETIQVAIENGQKLF